MNKLKYISIILTFLIFSCSNEKKYIFNDWSELNLKNKPKEIIECSSINPTELLKQPDSIMDWWPNVPIKEWFSFSVYSFDSLGFITNEQYHSAQMNSSDGKLMISTKYSRENCQDSIIILKQSGIVTDRWITEINILDWKGFPIKKITTYANTPVSIDSFERDESDRIAAKYSISNGIDDYSESSTTFVYNEQGDPILEISSGLIVMYNQHDTLFWNDTLEYKYLYDKFNNWILATSLRNGNIENVTERAIKY